jgi:AraC-like DNA-binding protein
MNYQEVLPSQKLRPFVKCFWQLEDNLLESRDELILPDGKMELIFQLGDVFEQSRSAPDTTGKATIAGQLTKAITIKPIGKISLFGVRFTPQGFTAIFEEKAGQFLNQEVFISDMDIQGKEIEEKIFFSAHFEERIMSIEEYLIHRLSTSRVSDLNTRVGSRILLETPQEDKIAKMAKDLKISLRQFERQFKDQVGLSPSSFIKIARFQKAIRSKVSMPSMGLAEVAIKNGYYDQSHFTRDCKDITGLSPKSYFRQEHQLNNCFSW